MKDEGLQPSHPKAHKRFPQGIEVYPGDLKNDPWAGTAYYLKGLNRNIMEQAAISSLQTSVRITRYLFCFGVQLKDHETMSSVMLDNCKHPQSWDRFEMLEIGIEEVASHRRVHPLTSGRLLVCGRLFVDQRRAATNAPTLGVDGRWTPVYVGVQRQLGLVTNNALRNPLLPVLE